MKTKTGSKKVVCNIGWTDQAREKSIESREARKHDVGYSAKKIGLDVVNTPYMRGDGRSEQIFGVDAGSTEAKRKLLTDSQRNEFAALVEKRFSYMREKMDLKKSDGRNELHDLVSHWLVQYCKDASALRQVIGVDPNKMYKSGS